METKDKFPFEPSVEDMPAFTSWYETFYELVEKISLLRAVPEKRMPGLIRHIQEEYGSYGFYQLAKKWTDEFERLHVGWEWDGDFWDEIEAFIDDKLANFKPDTVVLSSQDI